MYVKDIDRQKRMETEMRNRAERDDMTGFCHKSALAREVEKFLSCFNAVSGTFLMLDLDNFKEISDTFGHPFGDHVLMTTAEILKEQFHGDSVLGRLGGDEFAVFIPGVPPSELTEGQIAELMQKLGQIEAPGGSSARITCSIGISCRSNASSFGELYQQADQALYHSKQAGKARFTIYE